MRTCSKEIKGQTDRSLPAYTICERMATWERQNRGDKSKWLPVCNKHAWEFQARGVPIRKLRD